MKPSKDLASLRVCNEKNFRFWVAVFCESILAHVTWPRAKPLDESISLKFALETRLKSKVLRTFDQLSSISGSKVGSKIDKLINFLIGGLIVILLFLGHNF